VVVFSNFRQHPWLTGAQDYGAPSLPDQSEDIVADDEQGSEESMKVVRLVKGDEPLVSARAFAACQGWTLSVTCASGPQKCRRCKATKSRNLLYLAVPLECKKDVLLRWATGLGFYGCIAVDSCIRNRSSALKVQFDVSKSQCCFAMLLITKRCSLKYF